MRLPRTNRSPPTCSFAPMCSVPETKRLPFTLQSEETVAPPSAYTDPAMTPEAGQFHVLFVTTSGDSCVLGRSGWTGSFARSKFVFDSTSRSPNTASLRPSLPGRLNVISTLAMLPRASAPPLLLTSDPLARPSVFTRTA